MDLFNFGKFVDYKGQSVMEVLLCKFHFTHIKITNSRYLIVPMYHRWCLSLSLRQDNISEVFTRRHHCDTFKVILVGHGNILIDFKARLTNNYYQIYSKLSRRLDFLWSNETACRRFKSSHQEQRGFDFRECAPSNECLSVIF